MLARRSRRRGGVLAVLFALIVGMLVSIGSPAMADGTWCDPDTNECFIVLSSPPTDPSTNNPDSNGWTPGAPFCYRYNGSNPAGERLYVEVGCGNGQNYWSNTRQCYVSLASRAPTNRPPGIDADAGYYFCIPHPDSGFVGTPGAFWSNDVPPGLQVLTPGLAAARLISTFAIRGVDIGITPDPNPEWGHRRSYVGLPVWLWVRNPEPLTWGPYSETQTLGGQTITATARVSAIRWQMGDGGETVCGNVGTPYTIGYGLTESPTCGYRYTRTSSSSSGDRFTVTAVSQWVVDWTSAGGATGTINLTASNAIDLEVNELQAVNVPNPPNG